MVLESQVDTGRITALPQMLRDVPWKIWVRVAATGNVALATACEPGDTLDGVVLVEGDRILLPLQTAAEENGLYVVQASGLPLRAFDMDQPTEVIGAVVLVVEGTANAGKLFICTNTDEPEIDVDDITFAEFAPGSGTWQPLDADLTAIAGLTPNRGDLIRGGAAAWEDVALGADGRRLTSDGTDAIWEADYASLLVIVDGGGSVITTGIKADASLPFSCVPVRGRLLADQSGSIAIGVWNDTYASYPPTVADLIGTLSISGAIKSSDIVLSGWPASLAEGSTLRFNVDSVTSIQRVMIELKVRKLHG